MLKFWTVVSYSGFDPNVFSAQQKQKNWPWCSNTFQGDCINSLCSSIEGSKQRRKRVTWWAYRSWYNQMLPIVHPVTCFQHDYFIDSMPSFYWPIIIPSSTLAVSTTASSNLWYRTSNKQSSQSQSDSAVKTHCYAEMTRVLVSNSWFQLP